MSFHEIRAVLDELILADGVDHGHLRAGQNPTHNHGKVLRLGSVDLVPLRSEEIRDQLLALGGDEGFGFGKELLLLLLRLLLRNQLRLPCLLLGLLRHLFLDGAWGRSANGGAQPPDVAVECIEFGLALFNLKVTCLGVDAPILKF